jgi:uncharacterized protein YkwD
MKTNVQRRNPRSRVFLLLVLLGICFLSVISYTVTFAHGWNGWGGGGFPWSNSHGQGCGPNSGSSGSQTGSGSNGSQNCGPFSGGWQTCTNTGAQGTATIPSIQGTTSAQIIQGTATVQSQGNGTPTGTGNWQGWHGWQGWQNCGGTPPTNGWPCSGTMQPFAGTQEPEPTSAAQGSTPVNTPQMSGQTGTPCAFPTSTSVVPSTPPVVVSSPVPTSGVQPTPPSSVPTTVPTSVSTPGSSNGPESQAAQAVFAEINQERASVGTGLAPLQWSDQLQQSAHNHNMALSQSTLPISEIFPQQGDGYAHQLPGEPDLGTRISNTGLSWNTAAENVGFSSGGDATSAATGLNTGMFNEQPPDDGHRQNILSGNTMVGVDVVVDNQGRVWLTEDFAKPFS